MDLRAIIVRKTFRQIPGQIGFTRRAPDHRPATVTRNEIPPMFLQFLHAHPRHEISPRPDNARRETFIDQITEALVCRIEIVRPNPRVIGLPRVARLIRAARIERKHVGIKAGYDLDNIEAFGSPVCGEFLKLLGPAQPMAEAHPPGVAQPEEWRAVGVLEVSFVWRDSDLAVAKQRVLSAVCADLECALNSVQTRIV